MLMEFLCLFFLGRSSGVDSKFEPKKLVIGQKERLWLSMNQTKPINFLRFLLFSMV